MRKFVFYHLYAKNNYILLHNNIFARVVSNPFFDDCVFFFSIVIDKNDSFDLDRLIKPKKYFITYYLNEGSEYPALREMVKRSKEYDFKEDDIIGYFHCKGVSNPCLRAHSNNQKTLLASFGVEDWTRELSFLFIDKIQEFIPYLLEYGGIFAYPVRHLFGNSFKTGTVGNFWWVTGDVAKKSTEININEEKNRHYFEVSWAGEMLNKSNRKYKDGFYIQEGDITMYESWGSPKKDLVNSYFCKDLLPIINMNIPFETTEKAAIGIIVTHIQDENSFFETVDKFINTQRFQNFWIMPEKIENHEFFNQLQNKYNKKNILSIKGNYLIIIHISIGYLKNITEQEYFLDRLGCYYRNCPDNYDIITSSYKVVSYNGLSIVPNNEILRGKNHESY